MDTRNYWARLNGRTGRRGFLRTGGVAGAGLSAWALAGCGDDDDDGGRPSPAGGTSPAAGGSPTAAGSPAAVQPQRGQTLTHFVGGQAPHQDIHKASTAYLNGYGLGVAYSGLLRPQSFGHKNALIAVSDMAEKWEQPDQTTYVFKLRANAKFHNITPVNGRAVTADDFVYSVKRQVAEKVNASFYTGMKEIVAVDKGTLRISLASPSVDFIAGLLDPRNKVIAKEAVDIKGNLEEGPTIGTGPWVFKEWQKGVVVNVVRNPDYYISGLPYLDGISMPYSIDPAIWEAQFLAGRVPIIGYGGTTLPASRIAALDKSKFNVFASGMIPAFWVMYQHDTPQLKDIRIRRALSLAIDRELVLNSAYPGTGQLDAFTMILPSPDWALPTEEIKRLLPYDQKAAKQLFDAAGGFPKQTMPVFEAANTQAAGQVIQANWKAIGFETEIQVIDPIALNGNIFNPAAARYAVATTAVLHAGTLSGDLEAWVQTGAPRNSMKISDPELDRLIKAQREEFDEKKRKDLVAQIQRLIIDKMYYIPLGGAPGQIAYNKKFHNVEPLSSPNASFQWLQEAWLEA